ncbi:MAG: hypothetical protein PHC44_03045 [Lutispora sp.]|nr:hypothetical protein [Lutispora sp.]MDD4833692.1 hypothetical protein [Lutispora sp.]
MSLSFLPTPIYIAFVAFLTIVIYYYVFTIYGKEKKLLVLGYGLFGLAGFPIIMNKITAEYFNEYKGLFRIPNVLMGVMATIGALLILICSWNKVKDDAEKKRGYILAISLLFLSVLMFCFLLIIIKYKLHK